MVNDIKISGVVRCLEAHIKEGKTPLVRFRLGNKGEKGQWSWFTVKFWGGGALEASKSLADKTDVQVEGSLRTEEYKGKEKVFISALTVKVLGKSGGTTFVPFESSEEGKDIGFQ